MPEGASAGVLARVADHETGIVRVQAARLDALMNQVGQLVVSRTRMDRKLQAFAELRDKLYYCRARLGEIIALSWEDIDVKAKTLTVMHSDCRATSGRRRAAGPSPTRPAWRGAPRAARPR